MVSCDRAGFPVPRQWGCRGVAPSPGRSLRTGSHSSLWGSEDGGAGCPRVSELPCACFLPFQNVPQAVIPLVLSPRTPGLVRTHPASFCFPGHEHCIPTCCKVLWASPPLYQTFYRHKEGYEASPPPPAPLWGTKDARGIVGSIPEVQAVLLGQLRTSGQVTHWTQKRALK